MSDEERLARRGRAWHLEPLRPFRLAMPGGWTREQVTRVVVVAPPGEVVYAVHGEEVLLPATMPAGPADDPTRIAVASDPEGGALLLWFGLWPGDTGEEATRVLIRRAHGLPDQGDSGVLVVMPQWSVHEARRTKTGDAEVWIMGRGAEVDHSMQGLRRLMVPASGQPGGPTAAVMAPVATFGPEEDLRLVEGVTILGPRAT